MERLKQLRTRKGYSQQELADLAEVAQHTISEIELGRRNPHGRTLRKIAAALGVDIFDLTEEPAAPKGLAPLPEAEQRRSRSPWVRYVAQRTGWYESLFQRPPGEFNAPLSSLDTAIQFAVNLGTDLAALKNTAHELAALDPDAEEVRELVEVSDRFARFVERVDAKVSEMARAERGEEEAEVIRLRLIDGAQSA